MRRAPHKLAAILAAGAILTTGCSAQAVVQNVVGGVVNGLMNCAVTGLAEGITPEQNSNAQAIAKVALDLGLGQRGAEVGIVTALTESTLISVNYGDHNSSGTMTTSRGLFQQMDHWGPLEDRLDPTKAATMFYTGGKGGQDGLMDIEGWEQMTIPQAAQAVEKSQFADGSNYAKNLGLGTAITAKVLGSEGPKCTPVGGGNTITNGVNVTIPSNEHVAEAVRGKVIQAPSQGLATGLAAGFDQLGLPYVWGGSNANGGGPDDGCSRGGGELNSCGSEIGFDCSGLTAYVTVAAGLPGPGTNSSAQRAGNHDTPWANALPGDILGRSGHVAMYLGKIDGTDYILEASQVGTPIHIVATTQGKWDSVVHRTWDGSPA